MYRDKLCKKVDETMRVMMMVVLIMMRQLGMCFRACAFGARSWTEWIWDKERA